MSFCTVINCMDGRVQLPVIQYLTDFFEVDYVDSITAPGPVAFLSGDSSLPVAQEIFRCVSISVEKHASKGLAVVAHHDCAGNPKSIEDQRGQLEQSRQVLQKQFPGKNVIALWLGEDWQPIQV